MPEPIEKPVLRPAFKLSRQELASVIETATGQKPKDGFHNLIVSQSMDGSTGSISWVDAAGQLKTAQPKEAKTSAKKPASS